MGKLSRRELEQIRAIGETLRTFVDGGPPVLETIVPALRELLGAERSCAYGVVASEGRLQTTFGFGAGISMAQALPAMDRLLEGGGENFAFYNPARPQPEQRNRALRAVELKTPGTTPRMLREVFPRLGLDRLDQLRVLVCERESLLSWVGAFREEPFTEREQQKLGAIVPALGRRLFLDRQLSTHAFALPALSAALELLPGAAWILDASGRVVHASGAGLLALEADRARVGERLRAAVRDPLRPREGLALTALASNGVPRHFLAVEKGPPANPAEQGARLAAQWGLTQRQREVVQLMLRGYSNRSIAVELQCADSTVEKHVSAVLAKAGVKSRTALLARMHGR